MLHKFTKYKTKTGRKCEVVKPDPKGCSPCELPLEEGKILEITISLGGYDSWIKKISVSSALKINAKLNKTILPADSSDLNVNIGITPSND